MIKQSTNPHIKLYLNIYYSIFSIKKGRLDDIYPKCPKPINNKDPIFRSLQNQKCLIIFNTHQKFHSFKYFNKEALKIISIGQYKVPKKKSIQQYYYIIQIKTIFMLSKSQYEKFQNILHYVLNFERKYNIEFNFNADMIKNIIDNMNVSITKQNQLYKIFDQSKKTIQRLYIQLKQNHKTIDFVKKPK